MTLNTPNGIDWDFENVPVVRWTTAYRSLPAPSLEYPTEGMTNVPLNGTVLDWTQLDAEVFYYHLVVSTDPNAIPTVPTESGCLTSCVIDANVNYSGSAPNPFQSGTTYFWTVRGVGYKLGGWALMGNFTIAATSGGL